MTSSKTLTRLRSSPRGSGIGFAGLLGIRFAATSPSYARRFIHPAIISPFSTQTLGLILSPILVPITDAECRPHRLLWL